MTRVFLVSQGMVVGLCPFWLGFILYELKKFFSSIFALCDMTSLFGCKRVFKILFFSYRSYRDYEF